MATPVKGGYFLKVPPEKVKGASGAVLTRARLEVRQALDGPADGEE